MFILLLFLGVVFVEASTELLVKSVFFAPIRKYVGGKNEFLNSLITCGYCTSVWVAIIPALCLASLQSFCPPVAAFFLFWLALHRMSNYLHNINDKYFDKFYSVPK